MATSTGSVFPKSVAIIIGGYAAEWCVKPWVIERAPPLICPESEYRYTYGDCIGEHIESDSECDESDSQCSDPDPADRPVGEQKTEQKESNSKSDNESDSESDNDSDTEQFQFTAYMRVWENPRAEYLLRNSRIFWPGLAENPADWAVDFMLRLKTTHSWYPWSTVSLNTNPRIRQIWDNAPPKKLDWGWISTNPNAMYLIDLHLGHGKIDSCFMLHNPAAEKQCRAWWTNFNNANIAHNPADWAVEEVKKQNWDLSRWQWDKTDFGAVSNPHPYWVAKIREHFRDGFPRSLHGELCKNPSEDVFEYIRQHPEITLTVDVWANPNIFEMVPPPGVIDAIMAI